MNVKPILNIDGLDIYEYVVYKLEKPFYDDYLEIDVVSVNFVKIDDTIYVHFYANPYKENTYHPWYSKFADKIKIVGIDEENTFSHTLFLETKIHQYQKELEDFDYVCKKVKESIGEE